MEFPRRERKRRRNLCQLDVKKSLRKLDIENERKVKGHMVKHKLKEAS